MPWSPHGKYMWDFWFARKGTELHLFYLQASQLECRFNPDLRHDLSSVGHAVLTRWGWKELGPDPALMSTEGKAWDNRSIWTGSIIQNPDNRLYYMFYTARCNEDAPLWTPREWQPPQQIGVAVSEDLNSWQRTEASLARPVIPNPGPEKGLDGVNWRDPYVIQGEDGNFYAFICARPSADDQPRLYEAGGIVAIVKSKDLELWESEPHILIQSDEFYQMEVPQVFWRTTGHEKRFYLLFCAQGRDCSRERRARVPDAECQTGTYYMVSPSLPTDFTGFPELEEPARLLAPGLFAGRLLKPESEQTPMFYGTQQAGDRGQFVGGLSDPMRVQFNPDGSMSLMDEL